MRVYFDNASTTALLPEVITEMNDVMKNVYGNPSSIHNHGRKARAIIESSRKKVANILNASIGEIFFTSCATEANNMVLKMALEHFGIQRIIYSSLEHHCILHTVNYLKEYHGIETVELPVNNYGALDYNYLKSLLQESEKCTLVSIMHGNNEIGIINDIEKIGTICKENNAFFHSDIVQTVGKYQIDMQKLNIHFASGSAHKFHGPKGIGFVYIRNDAIMPPFILGGAQERNMRAGTENIYGIVGLSKALEISMTRVEDWSAHIIQLKKTFINKLTTEIDDIRINGDENGLYHIVSISFPQSSKSELLMFNLDIAGISCSSGSACSSGIESDSHVLKAIGHDPKRRTIRFSFSHFNTMEEVNYTVAQLKKFCLEKEAV